MNQQFSDYVKQQKLVLIILWAAFLFSNFTFTLVIYFLDQSAVDTEPAIAIDMVWILLLVQMMILAVTYFLRSRVFFSVEGFRTAIRNGTLPTIAGAAQGWNEEKLSKDQIAYLKCMPRIYVGCVASFALVEMGGVLGVLVSQLRHDPNEGAVFIAISAVVLATMYPRLSPCEERIREATYTQGQGY